MPKAFQAVRGMNDTLPEQTPHWQYVEATLRHIVSNYGYQEIRFPIVEPTELFKRSIGEVTDIVEKEMYTFNDRNGDSLTLRPEGTAGCLRAGLQAGIFYQQPQRLWYQGPMFRHERPQKGRYRQFYQLGAEAVGFTGPDVDAELIAMSARFWQALGIADHVTLQLNSIGSPEARKKYRTVLVNYLEQHKAVLDEDSQRRLTTNPLRILDSKNPDLQEIIRAAPSILDSLDETSQAHFTQLQELLTAVGISFTVNHRLVRGLDYYSHTVFEWVTSQLGAQGTVCAGGRYDGLLEQLGGKPTPACGFAIGLERLVLLFQATEQAKLQRTTADIYLIMVGDAALTYGFQLAHRLREALPEQCVIAHCGAGSFKSQFKRADKSAARLALIIGDEEVSSKKVGIKFLRESKEQESVPVDKLVDYLKSI